MEIFMRLTTANTANFSPPLDLINVQTIYIINQKTVCLRKVFTILKVQYFSFNYPNKKNFNSTLLLRLEIPSISMHLITVHRIYKFLYQLCPILTDLF